MSACSHAAVRRRRPKGPWPQLLCGCREDQMNKRIAQIGLMDQLASQNTPVHRLDPRAKLLTTLVFIATVASFGRYEISGLVPFFLYPVTVIVVGRVPALYLVRKIVLVAPFAILIGALNPVLDRTPFLTLGPMTLSGGWISFVSIIIRFTLTVGAALVLLATTGIHGVCLALDKLGCPRAFTVQLLFLYRYLYVLADEGLRMVRARAARSFGRHGMGMQVYGYLLGHLLMRTLDRAQRIHSAMNSRGFSGQVRSMQSLRFGAADWPFMAGWSLLFFIMRIHNVSHLLGALLTEVVL